MTRKEQLASLPWRDAWKLRLRAVICVVALHDLASDGQRLICMRCGRFFNAD